MFDSIKINGKQKKAIAIGFISIVVIGLILFAINKYRSASAESNLNSPGNDQDSSSEGGSAFKPGIPLTRIGKSDEAQELQIRYAGMSKEAIVADYIEWRFKHDQGMMGIMTEKAATENRTVEDQTRRDAIYLLQGFNVSGV